MLARRGKRKRGKGRRGVGDRACSEAGNAHAAVPSGLARGTSPRVRGRG